MEKQLKNRITHIFSLMDCNRSNTVTLKEFRHVYRQNGLKLFTAMAKGEVEISRRDWIGYFDAMYSSSGDHVTSVAPPHDPLFMATPHFHTLCRW